MQYFGGKARIARAISEVILYETDNRTTYIEPFTGAGSVAVEMSGQFKRVLLTDVSADLIMLWRAVRQGWDPPARISLAEYQDLRHAEPSPLRTFAGFGCSYGGKWFGGYARNDRGDNYARASRNSLLRKAARLNKASFAVADYRAINPPAGSVMYCDPPYLDATPFATGMFDSGLFWDWAREMSARCDVFVSEYRAPPGWVPIWKRGVQMSLDDNYARNTEELFIHQDSRLAVAYDG